MRVGVGVLVGTSEVGTSGAGDLIRPARWDDEHDTQKIDEEQEEREREMLRYEGVEESWGRVISDDSQRKTLLCRVYV